MAKEKLGLRAKLKKRKFRRPNPILYFVYWFACKFVILRKLKPEFYYEAKISECKGPCFLVWNHLSRIDHAYMAVAAWPKRINIWAAWVEFFRSHLATVFRLNQILPKKNFTQDIPGLKACQQIINKGGCVAFAPEAMSSIYGTNQPVITGTGHFLKHYNIPVYFAEMRGEYLMNNKTCLDQRIGKTQVTMKLLFTPEDLERMSDEEVDAKLNEVFRHDDYEWGLKNEIEWETFGRICERLDDICYKCPRCGAELQMTAKENYIKCKSCGNGASMDDFYDFHPFNDECVIPESPSKWVEWERLMVIHEIRKDPEFSYSIENLKFGMVPDDHYMKDQKCSEICGSGTLTLDHKGIHFKGTKNGEPFSIEANYGLIYTLTIEVATDVFAFYHNGEYYEFYPEEHATGKVLLIVEEMHRYHFNSWKNFPWNDWMYEGVERLAPDAPEYGK